MRTLLIRASPNTLRNSRLPDDLSKEVGYVPPLGIAMIAAYLRERGEEVALVDAEAEELGPDALRERIAGFRPDLVGVTSTTCTLYDDLAALKIAHECGARTVLGGPQANALPRETMFHPYVDFLIRGEGEIPMGELVRALRGERPLAGVPGLVYRRDGGAIEMNPPYIHLDLDGLPEPARDLLPNDRYSAIISKGRLTTLCVGRGCPYQCGFCFKQPSDERVRYRDPRRVVDEVEHCVRDFGIQEIDIATDTMTFRRAFVQEFCEEILRRDIRVSWIAPTRADCVDEDLLRLMKKAGCRSLRFGVESGSEGILEFMRKKLDREKTIRAFRLADQVGLETFAYFILGYIGETDDTVRETLNFVRVLKPDLLMYNEATPLPGTLLFQQAVDAGLVQPDYWERYTRGEAMPRIPYLAPKTREWVRMAYRRFFFSPRFILKRAARVGPGNIGNYLKALRALVKL